jgi:transcription elongation factor GreA
MKPNDVIMTKDGLEELKREYDELVNTKRPAVVIRLSEARTLGDLAENSEYSAAKDELAFIDGRIVELEEIIHKAKVVTTKKSSKVEVGCKVTVHVNGKKDEFTLVGEWEADPSNKKISHSSPLGKALMGKKSGDSVQVEAPAGKVHYKILHID